MKRTITVFGLIAGIILATFICISMPLMKDLSGDSMATSMFVGYTVQLIAFSLIFFAIKSYRDKHNGGTINFGRAFQIGLCISLIGSAFYIIAWAIIYYTVMPDFMDTMGAMQVQSAVKRGAPASEIAKIERQIAQGKEMYSTWWGFAGITLMEIFPTGLIVTLISAPILMRKQKKEVRMA